MHQLKVYDAKKRVWLIAMYLCICFVAHTLEVNELLSECLDVWESPKTCLVSEKESDALSQ